MNAAEWLALWLVVSLGGFALCLLALLCFLDRQWDRDDQGRGR
jgi:hypothetical protein